MDNPDQSQGLVKPRQNFLSNHYMLVILLFVSIISGFVIFRGFAGTELVVGKVTVEGTLVIRHHDMFSTKTSAEDYRIIGVGGDELKLNMKFSNSSVISNSFVRASGVLTKGQFTVERQQDIKTLQTEAELNGMNSIENGVTNDKRIHRLGVVLYNFANDKAQPLSASWVHDQIFDNTISTNAYFKEESNNQLSLAGIEDPGGDVFGYITLPQNNEGCDDAAWAESARKILSSQGHNMDAYDNVMYIGPAKNCNYDGSANIGGKESWIALDGIQHLRAVAEHELTHNFGTDHANSYYCVLGKVPVDMSDDCTSQEYGDPYDVMGINITDGHTYHSNNVFLTRLGLVPDNKVQTVAVGGSYELNPIEGTAGTTKVLRIVRAYDGQNQPEYYYLEYRQPYGRFDDFARDSEAVNGVMVRLARPMDSASYLLGFPYLVHTSKGDGYETSYALKDGQAFTDATHGIKIKQISHNTTGVRLYIDQPNPPQPDTTPPSRPQSLYQLLGSTKVNIINWPTSPEKDTSYYEVYRDGNYVGAALQQPEDKQIQFQDWTSLTVGAHVYSVRSVDYVGNRSQFTTANFITPVADASPPSRPTFLSVKPIKSIKPSALVCWSSSTDNKKVMGYLITRVNVKTKQVLRTDTRTSPYANGAACKVDGAPKGTVGQAFTDYQDKGAEFTYTVRAYDADKNYSAPSKSMSYTFR